MTLSDADRAAIEYRVRRGIGSMQSGWIKDADDAVGELFAALSDAEADAEQHRLDAASWRAEAERAADKYHDAEAERDAAQKVVAAAERWEKKDRALVDAVNRGQYHYSEREGLFRAQDEAATELRRAEDGLRRALALHRERRPTEAGVSSKP